MMRVTTLLLLLTCFTTGCYTCVLAPGAVGKVIDADEGTPVRGARISRPRILGTLGVRPGVPPEGIPAENTLSDRIGSFDLPPLLKTEIAFMYLRNPDQM